MLKIAVTVLLIVAWHFPTTFFVPAPAPNEHGWIAWPFGQLSTPAFGGLPGAIAPSTPTTSGMPTLALACAGIASLAFLLAILSLWGLLVPAEWWRPAALVGSLASIVLFGIYLSPWAVIPLGVDLVVLWGVLIQGWTQASIVAP
jgi:hypothetical protein